MNRQVAWYAIRNTCVTGEVGDDTHFVRFTCGHTEFLHLLKPPGRRWYSCSDCATNELDAKKREGRK